MARVNHKLVKQRLNEKRSSITDRQFFTSRVLAGHFEDIAEVQTKRYHYNRRVRVKLVWHPRDLGNIAVTDNSEIEINTGHELVTKIKGRENRYQMVSGLFAHELGHVLYTDFLTSQTHTNAFETYRWYPEPPALTSKDDVRREREFWEYLRLDKINIEAVQYVAHYICNVLEDGYIENKILNNFPGMLGFGLEIMRKNQFADMPTVTELIEQEDSGIRHIFESILQVILQYAKFGEIKYGDEPFSDIRIKTVFGFLDNIDDALKMRSIKARLRLANLILIRCWDYIKEFCEICKERQKEAETADLSVEISETMGKILTSVSGSSSIGNGGMPTPEKDGEETMVTAIARGKTKSDAEEEKGESVEETSESEDKTSEGEKKENSGGGDGENAMSVERAGKESEEDESSDDNESECTGKFPEISDGEKGRIPLVTKTELSVPENGTTEREEYERVNYERAASDIKHIMDVMAEKEACKEVENERLRELNDFAQNISYGNIHAGVNIRIKRITEVDEALIEQYQAICGPLLNISRLLKRSLVKQLDDSRRGGKQTGLLMGRKLDSHALHRTDGKVFCKTALPNDIPELSVALLLDESGSMSSCHRCTYARAAAIILYDFCRSLGIPIAIYGHSTSGSSVVIYSYAEYECIDNNDKYRLMDITARENNRDGAALRFTAERLAERPEEVKILIVVSDGQPADSGYYGTAAEEDLRGIKKEYQRKGILFVAAAIGNDKQNIERIYGDSFMDITDLNRLPVKLTSVVKRHIRV